MIQRIIFEHSDQSLVEITISIFGFELPVGWAIIAVLFLLAIILTPTRKRRKSWRIKASRKWLKEFKSNKDNFTPMQRFAYIRKVDHFLFEDILMSSLELRGYPIVRTPATRDGGSDGFVTIGKYHVVIQAKRYKGRIAKEHVIALENLVRNTAKLHKGLFIHTGKSSKPILDYVRTSSHLELISGVTNILNILDGGKVELFGITLAEPKA